MAGLYDIWKDIETGEEIFSYTIITTMPNEIVGKVHTRMPVILKKEDERKWLDSKFSDTDDLLSLLQPYASSEMEGWLVGNEVKSYKNDSPDLINPKVKTLKNPSTFL